MTRGTAAIALAIMACYPLAARVAAPEQPAPTVAEVRELLQANGTGDLGSQVGPVAAQQLRVALHRTNPGLSARADPIVMDVVVSYLRRQAEHDHVADKLVPIYAKYLTKDDVRRITDFYLSPAGRPEAGRRDAGNLTRKHQIRTRVDGVDPAGLAGGATCSAQEREADRMSSSGVMAKGLGRLYYLRAGAGARPAHPLAEDEAGLEERAERSQA